MLATIMMVELDNKTPAWWNWSFLFSFVFAIL
ncbi:MAG: hypothetical protein IPN97_07885 [Saprospiraceae bacterium]|nr:hypothetical protein [Saprospiraceae bacterium]